MYTLPESVDSKLGKMKKAVMGVFQITGKNSSEEYSYGGSYNTSEKNKTASITIRMENSFFRLDAFISLMTLCCVSMMCSKSAGS